MMEGVVPEYDGAGVVREPSGSTVTGIVPTNTYRCADGKFVIIGANGDSIFRRLCEAMDRPELAKDPRLASNAGRVEHEVEIDLTISSCEHFQHRDLFEEVDVHGKPLKVPAMMPKLSATPGRTDWGGPEVGEFNDEIYGDLLGLSAKDMARLKEKGVI